MSLELIFSSPETVFVFFFFLRLLKPTNSTVLIITTAPDHCHGYCITKRPTFHLPLFPVRVCVTVTALHARDCHKPM